jgi:membrane protease YdiL (CAAX protease family)
MSNVWDRMPGGATRSRKPGRGPVIRIVELLAVFAGLPLAYRAGILPFRMLSILDAVALAALAILVFDPAFDRRRLVGVAPLRRELPAMVVRLLAGAVLIVATAVALDASTLLDLPLHRRGLWARVLFLYPVVSALPQELLYRVYFFHRYSSLFGNGRAMIVSSAVAFAFLHLVFANAPSVALTLVAGLVLGWTYERTGSLAIVALEHALYGVLIFTIGLGRYFI